ncbi:PQQ-binding-like beta-propeller repeat protein [Actinomadura rifamycini]|uniref:outer membrane protein assembly factor BamB family protein n=1 Tax=Actinomadura rifamycini TaxID=31962 RepID=UPI00047B0F86|nr:PQQ-binding-like beta-propeller repeat protein [Actinomadura rifamycini]
MSTLFGNARRTGEYAGAGITVTPGTAWSFENDAELTGSPAWDRDLVVVLDVDGGVHGLDAGTGERRWSHRNGSGPATVSGSVVITPTGVLHVHEEEIIELDRRTGGVTRVWAQRGEHISALDGVLFVDGAHAVDLVTGASLWRARREVLLAPPAVHDGVLVVADGFEGHRSHGGVHAFRYGTGEPLWSIEDRQNAECVAPARDTGDVTGDWDIPGLTHPVIAGGRVWFTRLRRHEDGADPHPQPWDAAEFIGCDLRTGALDLSWAPTPGRHHLGPLKAPACTNGLLLCVTVSATFGADGAHLEAPPDETSLTALDARTAEPVWRGALPGVPVGSPVIAGGIVHVITEDGTIVALEAATGQTRWTFACGEPAGVALDEDTFMDEEEPARLIPGDGSLLAQTGAVVRLLRRPPG